MNLNTNSGLENGWGIYTMGGDWSTYTGEYLDSDTHTITRDMAQENWGSWFTYTIEALEDINANIFVKFAAPWREYGNAAATGCTPGPDSYQINDDTSLNWPKHYAGAMVISLDGENLTTTQVARPIAPDEYQARGTTFTSIISHTDQWTSTLNGNATTDTLWVWSRAGGNNSTTSIVHDEPDYRNISLSKGKHVIKVKSISSPWNFDALRFDCYAPSAVADIVTPAVVISAGKGCITNTGATSPAKVFSTTGQLVGSTNTTLPVPPGIYIVRHNDTVAKVLVY